MYRLQVAKVNRTFAEGSRLLCHARSVRGNSLVQAQELACLGIDKTYYGVSHPEENVMDKLLPYYLTR
jgi:hypothetical protein